MMAKPMAMPGRVIKVARVLLTALAAMAAVPKPETRESKRILPKLEHAVFQSVGHADI